MTRMVIKILFAVIALAYGVDAQGTVTDVNCSSSSTVQTAFNNAASGDTLSCTAGGTWASTVTFSGKSINFVGNGHTITMGGGVTLSLSSSNGAVIDVSGFVFSSTYNGGDWNTLNSTGGNNNGSIRLHNNTYFTLVAYALALSNSANVLVDNCTFGSQATRSGNEPLIFQASGSSTSQVDSLKKAVGFGQAWSSTIEWPTVENCTFWMVAGTNPSGSAVFDSWKGGKIRFRYNTIHDGYMINHGPCESWPSMGTYAQEINNNTFHMHPGVQHYAWWTMKPAGPIIAHNNSLYLWGANAHFDNYEYLQAQRDAAGHSDGGDFACNGNAQPYMDQGDVHLCTTEYSTDGAFNFCIPGVTDTCAAKGKGTCAKHLCSNEWKACSTNDDCSGGGTCTRHLDENSGHRGWATFGTGQWIDNATAYIESRPMHMWDNYRYVCDTNGDNCGAGTVLEFPDIDRSTHSVYNEDFFNRAPQEGDVNYPYAPYAYPHPLTGTIDNTPTAFYFVDVADAALSTVTTTSPCATIAGIEAGQTPAISISGAGCTYNVDGGAYTSDAGTVGLDNVVCLRGTSSGSYSTVLPSCTLTVGGVTDSGAPWTVTTLAAVSDPVAPRFRGSSMTGGLR